MAPFEITSDGKHGIPLSAIQLGGHQNAVDGGVDGRVEWAGEPDQTEWFPRNLAIFQSKAERMPRSKLLRELAPKDAPRPIFNDLAKKAGAYIVFSTDNCSPGMYACTAQGF